MTAVPRASFPAMAARTQLQTQTEEAAAAETETSLTSESESARELYLRDGRSVVVGDNTVEVRSESGLLEVRIQLTEQGPVLQMETVRMALRASESVEIESPRVAITGSEQLALAGGQVSLRAEQDLSLGAAGDVRVVGRFIYLN